MSAGRGDSSIWIDRPRKFSLLIALYSVRSIRVACEELEYHPLYQWFLDSSLMEPSFPPTTICKIRQLLQEYDVALRLFDAVVIRADALRVLGDEHFMMDDTLNETGARFKGGRPSEDEGNPTGNFGGNALERRLCEHDGSGSASGLKEYRARSQTL